MKMPLILTSCTLCAVLVLTASTSQAELTVPKDTAQSEQPETTQTKTPAAGQITGQKNLAIVPNPLATLAAPSDGLKVTAWTNRPNNTYTFGEQVVLNVKTEQDAYLTVLDVGTSGKVHVIFPNQFQKDNRVAAGQVIKIPDPKANFTFQAEGPAGYELIKVIATRSQLPLFTNHHPESAGPYRVLKGAPSNIARNLSATLHEQHSGQWGEYNHTIRIVPPVVSSQRLTSTQPITTATTGKSAKNTLRADPAKRLEPFNLHLRTERLVYPLGSKVKVIVSAERDCYLTLLDAGTSGRVVVLFPNRYQQNTLIRAGETLTIPGHTALVDYQLSGSPGVETLIGICQTENQTIYNGEYDFQRHAYQPWGNTQTLAKDLAVILRKPSHDLAHTATTFLVVEP